MDRYRVKPKSRVDLAKIDPDDRNGSRGGKKAAEKKIADLSERLGQLQYLLYAEHEHKVLIVLQAMDTAGKDGTIRHVFRSVNPQSCRVATFKVPTPVERDHGFLWRIHQEAPGNGEIVIFNRSHYEDVLVTRVHDSVPPKECRRRYRAINDFERLLAEEGTTIVKFYLHIDPDEQKRRLQERVDEPEKQWKFQIGDLAERKLWDRYMRAYEDAIAATSTPWAPWYIIPANHKWSRNLLVSRILVKTLEDLKMHYPPPPDGIEKVVVV